MDEVLALRVRRRERISEREGDREKKERVRGREGGRG